MASANPYKPIFGRYVDDSCTASEGAGSCQSTSVCKGISYPENLCPYDPNDVQCCVEISCTIDTSESGYCRSVSNNGCSGGDFHPGYCPGDDDIQCCVPTSTGTFPTPSSASDGSVGAAILAKAEEAAGIPYAWGGGSCDGPSGDQAPYDYGDVGYDCSGLVCWAVCQVTGRDLFSEGLRVTRSMYCASEETLGYKKYPYDERLPGDAIFFGGECDCENDPEGIHHVGLAMDPGPDGDRLWNAPSDDSNEVKESTISYFSDTPCEYVIRFT